VHGGDSHAGEAVTSHPALPVLARLLPAVAFSFLGTATAMSQTPTADFSARLDRLWDYNKPVESQARLTRLADLAKPAVSLQ